MATLVMRPLANTSPSSLSSGSIRSRRRVRSPSPSYAPPPLQPLPAGHPKRPLSPGSLRDVDVPTDAGSATRGRSSYPPPPTGHDLMAYFPPAAPMTNSELRPSSTYFAAQERAYFSRPGREIIRLDGKREREHPQQQRGRSASAASGSAPMPPPPQSASQKMSRDMPAPPPPPHHHHPYAHAQRSPPSAHPAGPPGAFTFPPPQPPRRHSRGSSLPRGAPGAPLPLPSSRSGPPPTIAIPPAQSPSGFSPHPSHMGGPPPPPQGPAPPSVYGPPGYPSGGMPPTARRSVDYGVPPPDEYDMEPVGGPGGDRGWRQPLAQAERRRAGKHTRRVIVK